MSEGDRKEVPQSSALAEATIDSLGELMNRDPEGYSAQDLNRVIEGLRMMRVKWEASELATGGRGRGASSGSKVGKAVTSSSSAEDLGL